MSYKVRIRPEAERDVRKAFSWYEEQRFGLGRELVAELDAVYERLSTNPYIYTDVRNGIRRAVVRRFPYGVFYLVAETEVRVLAVIDMARNPVVWERRADN